ncbi:MAG: DUF2723 domain-containing protein [bacterium]|nr:DUF2723 domain-containing protein [bacterium]
MNENKADKIVPLALFGVLGIFYLQFLNHRYFVDGLNDAWILETQAQFSVHPHHPLFPLLVQILYKLIGGTASGIDALALITTWALVFGIISLWGIQFTLKRTGLPLSAVLFAILLFAFSNGFWYFSTTPNQYSTALAFHVLTLLLLVPIASGQSQLTTLNACGIAILTGLAILSHEVNVLLLIPVIYVSWKSQRRITNTAITVGGAILIAAIVTLMTAAILAGVTSIPEFISWQHSYVTRSMYWADNPLDSIFKSFRGIIELHLAHAFHTEGLFGDWKDSIGTSLWYWRLLLRFAQAFVLLFLSYLTIISVIDFYKSRHRNPMQTLGLIATLPFFIFCFFFTPDSTNYRIFYLPGFILFITPGVAKIFRLHHPDLKNFWPLVLVIIALFSTNFITKYLPESDPAKNPFIVEAGFLALSIGPGDLVVYSGAGDDYLRMHYIKYFTHADTTYLPELIDAVRTRPDALIADIKKRTDEGYLVLIHEDALASPEEIHAVNDLYGTDIGDTELVDFLDQFVQVSTAVTVNGKEYIVIVPKTDESDENIQPPDSTPEPLSD